MKHERGMNERIRSLRKESTTSEPRLSLERSRLVTEAYEKYEGRVPTPMLRALTLQHIMLHKTLYLGPGELLVGEKAEAPQQAPSFPELCCHTEEDLTVMDQREIVYFRVGEDEKKLQKERIIPFWENRALRGKLLASLPKEWHDCYEAGLFTEFMEQRGPGHTVADGKMYQSGLLDVQKRIDTALAALDPLTDSSYLDKKAQLTGMRIACDAMMLYAARYAALAQDLAEKENDPQRKNELQAIASNCLTVPAHAPQTFHQALQMYWFMHIGVTTEINPWDAYSPGRLDQHLIPFYRKDLAEGRLTREQAKELLQCFWIKFNNQPAPPKVGITLKESGTYTDFANLNTGGITPDGNDGVNEVSYLILETMDEMRLLQPSSNVQISRRTPQDFLKKACAISRQGWGQPAFYNTESIVQELLNAGKSLEDARQGGSSGCVETGAFGKEAYILTGYLNLPKILELTLFNGIDPMTDKRLGPATGEAASFSDFDSFYQAYEKQLRYMTDIKVKGNQIIEGLYARYMPVPLLSCLVDDCIANGQDYNAGGARYNTSYIQGVGIGTLTDSLAAIDTLVYKENKFTLPELVAALQDNFNGHLRLHHLVREKAPRYGNDDDAADDLMQRAFRSFHDEVTGRPNGRGGNYRVNMLPTTCHVYFGSVLGASPNGRLAHKPVSEGISPEKSADRLGPTAVIRSAAKMDQLLTGGTLLNQKFNPAAVAGEAGLEHMAALVRAYFSLDGHHIQFNVIDRSTLLAAQEHPEDYKDLIVRVAGYSDHFHNLSRELQDEIIERTEQTIG